MLSIMGRYDDDNDDDDNYDALTLAVYPTQRNAKCPSSKPLKAFQRSHQLMAAMAVMKMIMMMMLIMIKMIVV